MLAQVLLTVREFDEARAVLERLEALPAEESLPDASSVAAAIRAQMELLCGNTGAPRAAPPWPPRTRRRPPRRRRARRGRRRKQMDRKLRMQR
jgi:hypothetical protein